MQETLIDQGINLMLFGMGTVFVFLTILVFATSVMSKVVSRFAKDSTAGLASEPPATADTVNQQLPHPTIIHAIEKAIAAHRQR